jgi:hypothetical protein
LNRVNDFKKRKPVEVCIPGADPPDSMLAHKDRGMRVVEQIACKVRKLHDDLRGDIRMSLRGDKDTKPGGGEQRHDKVPRCPYMPRASHDPRMSGDAQELIQDRPGGIPSICMTSLALEPAATCTMKWRVLIGSIYQHVGVDYEH